MVQIWDAETWKLTACMVSLWLEYIISTEAREVHENTEMSEDTIESNQIRVWWVVAAIVNAAAAAVWWYDIDWWWWCFVRLSKLWRCWLVNWSQSNVTLTYLKVGLISIYLVYSVLISAPSLGVYYFLSLTLSVCPDVCHAPSNCFFFVSWWNRAIFWPSVLHVPLHKTLFFDCWFRPPNAHNLLPKICTKSPISGLVCQVDQRCLGLPRGFRGWPIQWNHPKCCGAMSTKFGLGTEIQSPTGLYCTCYFYCLVDWW